jgi:hypothetical protein
LDKFSNRYFDKKYLCFVLARYTGSPYPKAEQIKINNGKYLFEIEFWNRSKDDPRVYMNCLYTVLYIWEIPKN